MPTTGINLTKLGWHGVYNLSLSMNNIDSYQKCHRQRTKSTDPQDLVYCVYTLSEGILEDAPLLTSSESTTLFVAFAAKSNTTSRRMTQSQPPPHRRTVPTHHSCSRS
jgi:hypothetical protein